MGIITLILTFRRLAIVNIYNVNTLAFNDDKEKMRTRAKVKFSNPANSLFFSTLKKRVDAYFIENNISKHANGGMVLKTIILLIAYIAPFAYLLYYKTPFPASLLLWALMGFAVAGIGMSIMHDGNHGAYSGNKAVNYITSHILNLLGASTFNWRLQHNIMHHTYTNIDGMDEDIEDKPLLRFSPHTPAKAYHKFQWIYAFFMYGLLTLYWVVGKDFVQFAKYIRNGVNSNTKKENTVRLIKIIIMKVVYFYTFLVMPTSVFSLAFIDVLTGFVLMHFIAGVILAVTFQLAHTVEGTSHPLPNNEGNIENEWAIHQLNTTVNFCRNNKWLSWYLGGLNFQIEHHLFPKISHVHYPAIANIVKETAAEFGIPYLENKNLSAAIRSHVITLQKLSVAA